MRRVQSRHGARSRFSRRCRVEPRLHRTARSRWCGSWRQPAARPAPEAPACGGARHAVRGQSVCGRLSERRAGPHARKRDMPVPAQARSDRCPYELRSASRSLVCRQGTTDDACRPARQGSHGRHRRRSAPATCLANARAKIESTRLRRARSSAGERRDRRRSARRR